MGCAKSADLREIQMEKTIAFAIRLVDLDPTSPNPSLVRRGMKIERSEKGGRIFAGAIVISEKTIA